MQKGIRCVSVDVCDYSNTDKVLCNLYDSTSDVSGQAYEVYIKTQRNGSKELRFKLPSKCFEEEGEVDNYRFKFLIADYRLRVLVKPNDNDYEVDWFLISEEKITHDFSQSYDVRASHISQLLKYKNLGLEFSDDEGNNVGTIGQIAETILKGTGWHLGYVAPFPEEEKYLAGEPVEKVRSFTAATKTGAFKMISDLCDLFNAKPIYHGHGKYIEDNEEKWGRTVDLLPMNPFSEDTEPGAIPEKVLEEKKVLELHYDTNVKNISRTQKTENLVTVLSSYGSYGDLNGMCSLQTVEHSVLTFTNLNANQEYFFKYNKIYFYFTPTENVSEAKWSSMDYVSRSYIYYDNKIIKTYKTSQTKPEDPPPIEIKTYAVEKERNYFSYLMDFSYYQKVGLLTDDMLKDLAYFQQNTPELYRASEESSVALADAVYDLMRTASDGEGFVRLDVQTVHTPPPTPTLDNKYISLDIQSTDDYPDGVIYRSDYDTAARKHFSWRVAKSVKENGQSVNSIGSVIYIVKRGNPTKWLKSHVKFLGNSDGWYVNDELNNKYIRHDFWEYDSQVNGNDHTIYIDQNLNKMYVWTDKYIEVQASHYDYGSNKLPMPTKIMIWSSDMEFVYNHNTDYVYLFSANSIAGLFGPREDSVESNVESVKKEVQVVSEEHPFDILYDNGGHLEIPSTTLAEQNYGWYYVMNFVDERIEYPEGSGEYIDNPDYFKFGQLYFLWGVYDTDWIPVRVSFSGNAPETGQFTEYYFNAKDKTLWRSERVESSYSWVQIKDAVDNNNVVKAFGVVIRGCIKQEVLIKGLAETYTWNGESDITPNNYAFKNEFNNYWLFTTDQDTHELEYIVKDKTIWQDDDEHHIIKPVEYTFDAIDFPSSNELADVIFNNGRFENETFYLEGTKRISGNVYVYEGVEYEANLPQGTIIVFLDSSSRYLSSITYQPETPTFPTPAYTTHIRIVCDADPDENHYIHVKDYATKLFVADKEYTLLECEAHGQRTGLPYLMDKFIALSDEAYQVRLLALKEAQQEITDTTAALKEELGDMYKEGFWQKNDYVEGDDDKLYSDSMDNLKEISQPETTYDFGYLDLYAAENQSIDEYSEDVKWPDIDITYAAHLIDMDIDVNCWAYIDTIDKCYDQPWKTTITINTKLSNMGQQSFTDVLASIAEVANQVKAKQTVYDRASAITDSGKLAAERLEGMIQANKLYITGGTSNWYTDSKGNMIFEDSDGESAMMLSGRGWMVSNQKDAFGDWIWETAASGKGINANAIYTGYLSADRIEAGSITVDKIQATAGSELDISSNATVAILATVDGSRPSGSLETLHPEPTDSWIAIGAQHNEQKAYIAIKSGGNVDLDAGGTMNIVGGTVNIESANYIGWDQWVADTSYEPGDKVKYQNQGYKCKTSNNDHEFDPTKWLKSSDGEINIRSGGGINIESGSVFRVNSDNFIVGENNGQEYVWVKGTIYAEKGEIAGFIIGHEDNQDPTLSRYYLYAGDGHTSINANNPGVYIGTDGINIANKFKFSARGDVASLSINAENITLGDISDGISLFDKLGSIDTGIQNAMTHYYNETEDDMRAVANVYIGDRWHSLNSGYDYICISNITSETSDWWSCWKFVNETQYFECYSQGDNIEHPQHNPRHEGINEKFYNVGDTWVCKDTEGNYAGKRFLCTSTLNKSALYPTYLNDWTKVNSDIKGAYLNINADAGTATLVSSGEIKLTSGSINLEAAASINLTSHGSNTMTLNQYGITLASDSTIALTTMDSSQQNKTAVALGDLSEILEQGDYGIYLGTTGMLKVDAGGAIDIVSGGRLTVDTNNFKIYYALDEQQVEQQIVEISGQITATSGHIANWAIGPTYIGTIYREGSTERINIDACQVGMASETSADGYSFWAGNPGAGDHATREKSKFYVKPNGRVKCEDLLMTGGDIRGDKINISAASVELITNTDKEWKQDHLYIADEIITYNGVYYKAIRNNNKHNFDISDWELLTTWERNEQYYIGNNVIYEGIEYIAEIDNKRASFTQSDWKVLENHILLKSGDTHIQLTPRQIEMNSVGKVSLYGNAESVIQFHDGTDNNENIMFQADANKVEAKTLKAGMAEVDTITTQTLNVTNLIAPLLDIPNIVYSVNKPSKAGTYWVKPTSSSTTQQISGDIATGATGSGYLANSCYNFIGAVNNLNLDGITSLTFSGSFTRGGGIPTNWTLSVSLTCTDGTTIDFGQVLSGSQRQENIPIPAKNISHNGSAKVVNGIHYKLVIADSAAARYSCAQAGNLHYEGTRTVPSPAPSGTTLCELYYIT